MIDIIVLVRIGWSIRRIMIKIVYLFLFCFFFLIWVIDY